MHSRQTFAASDLHEKRSAGFTLIESVVVVVLLGILAIYATPKFDAGTMTLDAQVRTVASNIQRTQNLAVTTGSTALFCVLTTTSYFIQVNTLNNSASCATSLPAPSSTTYPVVESLEQGVMFGAAPDSVSFDSLGQPPAAGKDFTVGTKTVSIIPVTGLVTY